MTFKTIGIAGAGVIGSSLAQHISNEGLDVILVDVSIEAIEKSRNTISKNRRFQAMLGKSEIGAVKKGHISYATSLSDLPGADYVIECVTENFNIKQKVFVEIDLACKKDCIIASNTSAIPIKKLAELTKRKEQIIGLHFMNPVTLIDAVEMISGPYTSDKTLETSRQFLKAIHKEWIHVNDSPGFVSNRVLMLTINESIHTLEDGVAAAADIDKVFKSCFNHKMGPLETADLIGLDTILHTLTVLQENFRNDKFKPSSLLLKKVEMGELGRKSGKGFYEYYSNG